MLTEVEDDVLGPVLMHNVLWGMSATPGRIRHVGRAKGADTDQILGDAGLSPERISELRQRGVVV
jgi:crotonobetainyl-CoA:carnitine CoA-transferase CaiB-like acyl-CoA transferase